MYEASTERLGEVAIFFLQVWLPTQSYKEHKNKRQKKTHDHDPLKERK